MEPYGSILRRPRARRVPNLVRPNRLRLLDLEERLVPTVFNIANGGALLLNAGDLTISGGTFLNNRAAAGGAMYTTTTSTTPRFVSVTGATFVGNQAMNGARGAILNFGSSALNLTATSFTRNV